jgi:hypothetical protein
LAHRTSVYGTPPAFPPVVPRRREQPPPHGPGSITQGYTPLTSGGSPDGGRDAQLVAEPLRDRLGQPPPHGDRLVTLPIDERYVTTVHERRGAAAGQLLARAHEQVDGDAALQVVADILPVRARLARSILRLPLELGRADEVVLVLERRAVAGLVQRREQEDVAV